MSGPNSFSPKEEGCNYQPEREVQLPGLNQNHENLGGFRGDRGMSYSWRNLRGNEGRNNQGNSGRNNRGDRGRNVLGNRGENEQGSTQNRGNNEGFRGNRGSNNRRNGRRNSRASNPNHGSPGGF